MEWRTAYRQPFGDAVRESRLFFRRRLTAQLMVTVGMGPAQAVKYAEAAGQALAVLEEAEMTAGLGKE